MVAAARKELIQAGITESPEVLLADAGYWHGEQIQTLAGNGIKVLVPPDADRAQIPKPNFRTSGLAQFMRRALTTPAGHELYQQRQQNIEPVFGHTKFNRRCDRFQRRGLAACRSEWRLIAATHNLLKLHTAALTRPTAA